MRLYAQAIGVAVIAATVIAWAPETTAPKGDDSGEVCRLPVSTGTQIGFISYPSGSFTAETTAMPALPGSSQTSSNLGYAFDRQLSRWVPVTQNLVSPDGSKYVFGDLEVVDVATGVDTQLVASVTKLWHPIGWEPEGIYAVSVNSQGQDPGLWLITYPGGKARQIIDSIYWQAVRNGGAYGLINAVLPPDTTDAMNRVDVRTGEVTKWFFEYGTRPPYIAGFDASGAPVIQQSVEVYVVPTAMQPILVTNNTHASSAIGDKLGIWIGNSAGLFLFAGGKFTQVTDMPASPAGVCLAADSTGTPPPQGAPRTYTVRPGDTLSGIARAFGLSSYLPLFWRNEWRPQANGGMLTDPNLIRPGWVLEIPTEPLGTYVVRGGDSLSAIAERFYGAGHGAWWHGIYDANRDQIRNPALIYPGQRLRIP